MSSKGHDIQASQTQKVVVPMLAIIDARIVNVVIPMCVNEAVRALKINRRQFARKNLAINNEQPYRSQVIAVVIE